MTDSQMPTSRQIALAAVVVDIERAASRAGWDHAPSLYALVPTADLVAQPGLPADLAERLSAGWDGSRDHLSAVVQDDLAEDDLEEVLGHLAWPENVAGAALTVERIVVPPQVEEEAPEDPEEALRFISNHPSRTDVRLAVGALRSGETWCALRTRAFDSDDKVGQGSSLVPGLVEALLASLEPDGSAARG
ncbi:PPA1309 family protein [Actinomyces sp. B33]|uniref:PPA1309 family protein n=1 Tax=Actinomyces sp. B33 TaxID=2942131 RepID=UPI002340E90F|nr:PPA1309 family protein [Actinomyces sp. B33]MDC4233864.1 PPA1309 family protein [Actinomyces sp. B33]